MNPSQIATPAADWPVCKIYDDEFIDLNCEDLFDMVFVISSDFSKKIKVLDFLKELICLA